MLLLLIKAVIVLFPLFLLEVTFFKRSGFAFIYMVDVFCFDIKKHPLPMLAGVFLIFCVFHPVSLCLYFSILLSFQTEWKSDSSYRSSQTMSDYQPLFLLKPPLNPSFFITPLFHFSLDKILWNKGHHIVFISFLVFSIV